MWDVPFAEDNLPNTPCGPDREIISYAEALRKMKTKTLPDEFKLIVTEVIDKRHFWAQVVFVSNATFIWR